MKYRITMKDGTQYTDEQPGWFINAIAHDMAETEFTRVHQASDKSFVIRCSEIASVEQVESQEDAA